MLLELGAVHPHLGLAGLAALGKAPVGQDHAVQVLGLQLQQVLRGRAVVVLAGELLDERSLVWRQPLVDMRDEFAERRFVRCRQPSGHSLPACCCRASAE